MPSFSYVHLLVLLSSLHVSASDNPGMHAKLSPCPDSPNCVSSLAAPDDQRHFVAPLRYASSKEDAQKRMLRVLNGLPRTQLIQQTGDYWYLTQRSRLFRFVDDVEFSWAQEGMIHVRSSSRTGYSDLGVNRRRIETIRRQFESHRPTAPVDKAPSAKQF